MKHNQPIRINSNLFNLFTFNNRITTVYSGSILNCSSYKHLPWIYKYLCIARRTCNTNLLWTTCISGQQIYFQSIHQWFSSRVSIRFYGIHISKKVNWGIHNCILMFNETFCFRHLMQEITRILSLKFDIVQHSSYNVVNGGAHGVMVIVAGSGHSDTSSNLGRDWLHFT